MRFLITMSILLFSSSALAGGWILPAPDALPLLEDATILDVRSAPAFALGHVVGSARVTWEQFSQPDGPSHGELLDDAKLQAAIESVGVRADSTVIVIGDPQGWGEDGRIVWMLRAVGHQHAFAVDGGYAALKAAGAKTQMGTGAKPRAGKFSIAWDRKLIATTQDVADARSTSTVVIDVRETREFHGKTPYGEARGGHVPGAKHLWFKDLRADDGRLLPRDRIVAILAKRGITMETPVIAYCTGGIRSGWVVMVLQSLGYNASNYAGSMWKWASLPAQTYPLEK